MQSDPRAGDRAPQQATTRELRQHSGGSASRGMRVVLARAMVRDLYEGDRAARMLSKLMTVMAIAPLLGPILGGQILRVGSWRAIFWTLVVVGGATLAALFTLPETLPTDRRNRAPLWRALASYGVLVRQRRLMGFAGAGGFFYAGIFAYVAGTPFAYIDYHHVPPQFYGLLFGAAIIAIMAANLVNARLVIQFGGVRLLRAGTAAAAVAGLSVDHETIADIGPFHPLERLVDLIHTPCSRSIDCWPGPS